MINCFFTSWQQFCIANRKLTNMKNFTFILSLFLIGSLITACNKKDCTDPKASNYESNAIKEDGSCKYFKSFRIERIELNEYDTLVVGDVFDDLDNSNADVYFELRDINNNLLFSSTETYFDAPGNPSDEYEFEVNLGYDINNLNEQLIFSFMDYDELGDDWNNDGDDEIYKGIIYFENYTSPNAKDKFPNKIEIENGSVDFDVYIEWLE